MGRGERYAGRAHARNVNYQVVSGLLCGPLRDRIRPWAMTALRLGARPPAQLGSSDHALRRDMTAITSSGIQLRREPIASRVDQARLVATTGTDPAGVQHTGVTEEDNVRTSPGRASPDEPRKH